jgi:outer membrane protein assembly factor BamA
MHSACLSAVALALLVVGGALPAAAADEPRIEVHSLSFRGVRQVDAGELKTGLATRVSSRLPWGKKALFDRTKFEADLERIRAFYVDRGFPDARVTSFDVRLNPRNTRVDITVSISEGDPIRVASVDFKGMTDVPPRRVQALRAGGAIKEGQPLNRPGLAAMREAVLNVLRDSGYPYAQVGVETVRGADPHRMGVVFTAEPGVKAYFGKTGVTGNQSVSEGVILRELLYHEGQLYRRTIVQETQRKLYDLELFQFVTLRPDRGESAAPGDGATPAGRSDAFPVPLSPTAALPRLGPPDDRTANAESATVPMRLTVTEGKHRRVQFSAGYGTEEKARVEGQYRRLNFLGGARTATIRAKWSSLDRGVRAELNNPYFFAPRWSLQLSAERWYDSEPAYTSVASGGHAVVTYRPGRQTSFSLTLTDEYQSSEISNAALSDLKVRSDLIALGLDPTTGTQDGTLNAIAFDARRATSANPLNATSGYSVQLHLERAGRWVRGSFAYVNASLDGRYYVPVGRRLVVAARAQAGSLRPDGNITSDIPFSKRYFLGGATSLRGWGRYELSPLSGSGLPIGGFSAFEGSLEARIAVTASLGLVAFADFGNVWTDAWRLRLHDLRYDVGPGIRYNTPVGPLRVDLGYQLNPIPGLLVNGKPESRRWRIHFSIGQAF